MIVIHISSHQQTNKKRTPGNTFQYKKVATKITYKLNQIAKIVFLRKFNCKHKITQRDPGAATKNTHTRKH